jgi:hypothetical protein
MSNLPYMLPDAMQGPHRVTAVALDITNPATFDCVAPYPYNGAGTDTGTSTGTNTDASTSPSAVSVSSSVTSHSSSSSQGPPRRGPGRPRTRPLPPPLPEGVEAPPKQGPGRPRKHPLVNGENPPPKRSRGRPPNAKRIEETVRTPGKRPSSRLREVTPPENPVWSQNLNSGSSLVLEDLFPDLPPLPQSAGPQWSPSPMSLPWHATPTLESLELRMWSPPRTMVPAAPPQPSIPLRDDQIIWRGWLVDDIVDSWDTSDTQDNVSAQDLNDPYHYHPAYRQICYYRR